MKKLSTKLDNKYVEAIINRPNGITLISLIIIIVILIILSAVVISLTLGDNGIFNKAKYAKEEYKKAELNEQIAINETTQYVKKIDKQKITSIELNKTDFILYSGETEQLEAIIFPTNAYKKDIEWISEDEDVAIVSTTGMITAKSSGKTKIIVREKDGSEILASCIVKVLEKVYLVKDGIEQVEFEKINIKSYIQEDDYVLIETVTTNNRASYEILNLIKLDEYKSIKADVEIINFVYSTVNVTSFEFITSENMKIYEGNWSKGMSIIETSHNVNYKERNTYTLDVEGVMGTYGLGFRKNASPNTSVTFKLYNMWLEK